MFPLQTYRRSSGPMFPWDANYSIRHETYVTRNTAKHTLILSWINTWNLLPRGPAHGNAWYMPLLATSVANRRTADQSELQGDSMLHAYANGNNQQPCPVSLEPSQVIPRVHPVQ